MTRDEILRIAQKASVPMQYSFVGGATCWDFEPWLKQFADLVAAAEREQCVNVCEAIRAGNAGEYAYITSMAYRKCAEAIRARGQS